MAILDSGRAVEQAVITTRVKRSSLLDAVRTANEAHSIRPPEVRLCESTGNMACVNAYMSQLSTGPCRAARELDTARRSLQTAMQTLATDIQNTRSASQKHAEYAARTMRAADAEDSYSIRALTLFRQSSYANYDPVSTPLFLMAFNNPYARGGSTESWLTQWYASLVGQEYARAHPIADPPPEEDVSGGGSFSWGSLRYILPIGLGLGGGILVIWGLRKVGL